MMSYMWIFLLASLVIGPNAQDLDLGDALGPEDAAPTTLPAAPEPAAEEPKEPTGEAEPTQPAPEKPPTEAPKAPEKPAGDDLDLGDALGPDPAPVPEKPAVDIPTDEGNAGGSFGDSDLVDVGNNDNDNKPDGGKARAAADPPSGPDGGAADEPQEAGSGQIAGIIAAVGAAIAGAAGSYFAYYKKKLCFKIQGDPESANKESGTQSDPQAMSNLLKSS